MFVIKRDGKEVEFNREKIINAIKGANKDVLEKDRLTETEIENISIEIEQKASKSNHTFNVEEFKNSMQGIYTTSINAETLDECPMAYKNMDDIVKNITPTAEIVNIIKPIYNFKAGETADLRGKRR